jgi:hypothetical protein
MNANASRLMWLLVLTALAAVTLSAAGQPFSVTLAAPRTPVKSGAELRLLATIKNTSTQDAFFQVSPGGIPEDWFRYKITVLGPGGRPAPPSARVLKLRKLRKEAIKEGTPGPMSFFSNTGRTLKPGQSFVDGIDVTKVYDLSQPGVYTMWVTRQMPPMTTPNGVVSPKGTVRPNTITVTVVK